MNNEIYLIVSYFCMAMIGIGVAAATWAYLRRSHDGTVQKLSNRNFSRILSAAFPAGLALPALLGFVSVSYTSCGRSYGQIVHDRAFLIQRNHEQISSILLWIVAGLLFWNFVILLALKFAHARSDAFSESRKR